MSYDLEHRRGRIVLDYINELWNSSGKNFSELHNIFDSNLVIDSPIAKKVGVEDLKEVNQKWLCAFPDLSVTNIELVSEKNKVVTFWRGEGKHENKFDNIDPTGKTVLYKGVTYFEFGQDKIARYKCVIDMFDIYKQLGFVLYKNKYANQNLIFDNRLLLIEYMKKVFNNLTSREIECLSFWVNGRSSKQIGAHLKISYKTVEQHILNIMTKTGVCAKHELIDKVYDTNTIYILRDLYDHLISIDRLKK